jgi:hypothetical protein
MSDSVVQRLGVPASVRPSLPLSWPAAATMAGDVLAVVVFTVAGLYSHNTLAWEVPVHTLETLAPFLIAWGVVAPLAGVYHRQTLASYRLTVPLVVLAWTLAALLGSQIRATDVFPGGAPLTFVLVSVGVGMLCLLPIRLLATWGTRHVAG